MGVDCHPQVELQEFSTVSQPLAPPPTYVVPQGVLVGGSSGKCSSCCLSFCGCCLCCGKTSAFIIGGICLFLMAIGIIITGVSGYLFVFPPSWPVSHIDGSVTLPYQQSITLEGTPNTYAIYEVSLEPMALSPYDQPVVYVCVDSSVASNGKVAGELSVGFADDPYANVEIPFCWQGRAEVTLCNPNQRLWISVSLFAEYDIQMLYTSLEHYVDDWTCPAELSYDFIFICIIVLAVISAIVGCVCCCSCCCVFVCACGMHSGLQEPSRGYQTLHMNTMSMSRSYDNLSYE